MRVPVSDNGEDSLRSARDALIKRQGVGARYDAPDAPAQSLAWARLGTAYFARCLAALSDRELMAPSLKPDWSRSAIVAQTGYHARNLATVLETVRTARPLAMNSDLSIEPSSDQILSGTCLPARALRHLYQHSAVHLNVEWRDLSSEHWSTNVVLNSQTTVHLSGTPRSRALLIWANALALDSVGRSSDVPRELRAFLAL